MISPVLIACAVSLSLAYVLRAVFMRRLMCEKRRRLGCASPPKYPHRLPWGLDLHRSQLAAAKKGGFNRFSVEMFNRYGSTYESTLMGTRYIHTRSIENLREFLAFKHNDYQKQPFQRTAFLPLVGPGLLSAQGSAWRRSRDLVTPLFKRAEVGDIARLDKHVENMIAIIPTNGSTIDLAPLVAKMVIDASTEFIFGHSVNSLSDETGGGAEFLKTFDEAVGGAGKRGHIAGGRLQFLYKNDDKKWLETCGMVHSIVDTWISRALDAEKPRDTTSPHHYILVHEMAKEIPDRTQLRYELLNVFSPSRNTTAALLSNTLFFLARHPDVWAQLRQQAIAVGDRPVTFELLKSLTLFRYTLQEAIRLQGPSGQVSRQAIRDTVLPSGGGSQGVLPILVPEGTIVVGNNFPIYHDSKIWGDDVEEFRPSRFQGKVLTWEFVPFLGGPRICPAQQQVYTTGVYLLYRLAREFQTIENRDPCLEYVEEVKMLCQSKNGVQVALHRGD